MLRHGLCRMCQVGRGDGGLRGRVVLSTSGMWTDENRLLQKLHQEAGECRCFGVMSRGSKGVMAISLEQPSPHSMCICLASHTSALRFLFLTCSRVQHLH